MKLKRKSACTEFTIQLDNGEIITYTEHYDEEGFVCSQKIDYKYVGLIEEIQDLIEAKSSEERYGY